MLQPIQNTLVKAIVLIAGILVLGAADAQAGWWHSCGSSGGSYGSWGSRGSWGSHGGLFSRLHRVIHHRRHYASHGSYGSYGSYGGGYSSYGSYGGGYARHAGYAGGYASCGSSGGVIYSTPVVPADPAVPSEPGDAPPAPDEARASDRDAILNVNVPAEADVFVNGYRTKSTGESRSFISRNLARSAAYKYEVRAAMTIKGQTVEKSATVVLRGGEHRDLVFDFKPVNPITTLTLHVPDDAKVLLGGVETDTTGDSRVFSTTKLASGNHWKDYTVQVSVARDGQQLTKQQTITLSAGDQRELNFEFDEAQVALSR